MRIDWFYVRKTYESFSGAIKSPYRRSGHQGLLDFSASVRQGITVILGPKGAGKSTLLKLTATDMVPDDGRIMYQLGEPEPYVWSKGSVIASGVSLLSDLKEKISHIPHTPKMEQDMTVAEALLVRAQLYRVPQPKKKGTEMIAKWGLAAYRKTPLCELTGGALKRYLLAQSLITSPKVWILDEPTAGLDDLGKKLLWEELRQQPRGRITLIATEKDMELAELADDLLLMDAGACRRLGRKKYLTASVPEGTVAAWYQAMQAFSHLRHTRQ